MLFLLKVHGVALLQSSAAEIQRAANFVHTCLLSGSLSPTVSLELPFSAAAAAHDEVIAHKLVKVGNIVLSGDWGARTGCLLSDWPLASTSSS